MIRSHFGSSDRASHFPFSGHTDGVLLLLSELIVEKNFLLPSRDDNYILKVMTFSKPALGSVEFQQFCDGLRTALPGDFDRRGCLNTSARFVIGDPGAKFAASAPLESQNTGEVGHRHWEATFEYILRQSTVGGLGSEARFQVKKSACF